MNDLGRPQFGEQANYGADDHCYRHPDRGSFTLCHRCGKTICSDCQTGTPVGVICPDCRKQHSSPRRSQGMSRFRAVAKDKDQPFLTYLLMGASGLVFIAQMLFPQVTQWFWYAPVYSIPGYFEPWRMITAIFTHSTGSFFHILFNMYALWLFGRNLEMLMGRLRFGILYFMSGFGGSLAVMLWVFADANTVNIPTVGASGAIFGVLGATLVAMKTARQNATSLFILIGLNLAIGFLPGMNISWQAHLGGLLVGMAVMAIFLKFAGPRKTRQLWLSVSALIALMLVLSGAFFLV